MLVLSRKTEETIHIGEGIVLKVLRVSGDTVKLGIAAPDDMSILRGELYEKQKAAIQYEGAD